MPNLPGPVNLYDQASRSLNYLQGAVDYWQSCTPFFWTKFDRDATWLQHNHWDHCENPGRFLYAAVLSRIILGVREELPVEKCFRQQIYQSILPGEALSFRPNPSPYETRPESVDVDADLAGRRRARGMEADLWDNRSVFTGLLLSALNTGDDRARTAADRMVEALKQLAVRDGDCAWFTRMAYPAAFDARQERGPKLMGQNMGGWVSPLVFYYRQTGDCESLDLAARLARCFVESFPVLIAREEVLPQPLHMNVHSLLYLIAGLARVGRVTGDEELLAWARRQYGAAIGCLASDMGWIREFLPSQHYDGVESCETCTLADRIDAGIQLALAGHEECWNDVQRCVVNYLSEAQFKDTSWLPVEASRRDDFCRSYYHVRERLVGSYVGWGAPNDLVEPDARVPGSVQNCCGPHGAFAVYQAWHNAVRREGDGIHVNLAVSRDTPWCSIVSGHPASDALRIRMKCDGPLRLRLPDSSDGRSVRAQVNGRGVEVPPAAGRVIVDARAGDVVVVSWKQRETETVETLNGREYKLKWKGDFVVGIEPNGSHAPLFQRRGTALEGPPEAEPDWPDRVDEIDW